MLKGEKGLTGIKYPFAPITAIYMGDKISLEIEKIVSSAVLKENCKLYRMIKTGLLGFDFEKVILSGN